MVYKSPKRRPAGQKSGFKASGVTTGGECKINKSEGFVLEEPVTQFTFQKNNVQLNNNFGEPTGLIGLGGYLRSNLEIKVKLKIQFKNSEGKEFSNEEDFTLNQNKWHGIGSFLSINLKGIKSSGSINASLIISGTEEKQRLDVFGFCVSEIRYFKNKPNLKRDFFIKTNSSIPEILHLPLKLTKSFNPSPKEYSSHEWSPGISIVLKSCNRCERYLPIDLENPNNTISFSNHHRNEVCAHSLFGSHTIVYSDDPNFQKGDKIQSKYGYQLECKSCKKFTVNAPLNPKRTQAQHKEDSLRRREVEILLAELYGKKHSIHQTWRLDHKGEEFEQYIFEKFGKKCFNCKKVMASSKEQALDHTRALANLWPLDEYATCLCSSCNGSKSAKPPSEFYSESQLTELAEITGLSLDEIKSNNVNIDALKKLSNSVVWFFDKFLAKKELQKKRDGKLTADNIYRSIEELVRKVNMPDLLEKYRAITGHNPTTITTED